ncbi:unnamed protein product [Diatraea saccharalis]|uniref:Zinc finger DNA binding protein n=1 Tax=Diatraea saccharalis TaxID=40085 RepID=A0A9N9QZB7_9NEOP|nr:unnamed protein product [Diatraea saccharalis]
MSMKRTPPKAMKKIHDNMSNVDQYSDTASDILLSDKDTENSQYYSRRNKRKHGDTSLTELKEMLMDLKLQQNEKFSSFQNDILSIGQQYSEIQKSLEFMSAKYDDVLVKLDKVQQENKDYKTRIHMLENKIDLLECSSRTATMELRNLPLLKTENKTTLSAIVCKLSEVINQPVQVNQIRDIYRVKSQSQKISPIIVEFINVCTKENMIRSAISYNKCNKEHKLNSSNLLIDGPPRPIYLTDSLSSKNRRLYFLSREFARKHGCVGCWTSYGKVYLKIKEDMPPIRIKHEEDLEKLFK